MDSHIHGTKPSWIALAVLVGVGITPSVDARHSRSTGEDAALLANCPAQGDARSERVRELNTLKRRMTAPGPGDIDGTVSLASMVSPGNDYSRFDLAKGATLSGYVADVKVGGVESVNCHTHDPLYRDTHIELTISPINDAQSKHVIVEVTPQWRQAVATKGLDWTTQGLRRQLLGRWISVTGWLLFDEEHANASVNTSRPGARVWRATAWEVHPVTAIQILSRKP